jgi:hypothetical protein
MVGRIAVARSVDNDDDSRWLARRLHRSFGSSVDVNPRFFGWLLLVIGAGPVELSIAQHNAALGENGTLQFCDGYWARSNSTCKKGGEASASCIGFDAGNRIRRTIRRPHLYESLGLFRDRWRYASYSRSRRAPKDGVGLLRKQLVLLCRGFLMSVAAQA